VERPRGGARDVGCNPYAAAPTDEEWVPPSEPWLLLIDAAGKVAVRNEGGIDLTELDPAVQALVGATPS
jgi:hypothetical protein